MLPAPAAPQSTHLLHVSGTRAEHQQREHPGSTEYPGEIQRPMHGDASAHRPLPGTRVKPWMGGGGIGGFLAELCWVRQPLSMAIRAGVGCERWRTVRGGEMAQAELSRHGACIPL